MRKILAIITAICLVMSLLVLSAFAAKISDTHLYNSDNSEKLPFDKQDITVNINGTDYEFTHSGSGTWDNVDDVPELGLPDEGEGSSLPVIITDEDGNSYNASLSNHSDKNGSNGNNNNGTDTYNISGVSKIETPSTPSSEPEGSSTPSSEPEGSSTPSSEPEGSSTPSSEPEGSGTTTETTQGDEEVPPVNPPKTGDASLIWAAISGLSACGMLLVNKKRR